MVRSPFLLVAALSCVLASGVWADIAPLPIDPDPSPTVSPSPGPAPTPTNPYAGELDRTARALQQAMLQYLIVYFTNPWDSWALCNAYWRYVDAYNRYTWAYWCWKRSNYIYSGQLAVPAAASGTGADSTSTGTRATGGTVQGVSPAASGTSGASGSPVSDGASRNLNDPFSR